MPCDQSPLCPTVHGVLPNHAKDALKSWTMGWWKRVDYNIALQYHYANPSDDSWKSDHISRYASSHPWEDWAESSAHFLHMMDVVETSRSVGLIQSGATDGKMGFAATVELWLATTIRLNELGRSMGTGDLYPFVLSDRVIGKMEFIHDVISGSGKPHVRQEIHTCLRPHPIIPLSPSLCHSTS